MGNQVKTGQAKTAKSAAAALYRLRWQLRLTHAGIFAERLARGFWPLPVLAMALAAVAGFGWDRALPREALLTIGWAAALVALSVLAHGIWRFRWPLAAEAMARLDHSLPGRPITALRDAQALGAADAGSVDVWAAHLQRMAAAAARARPVAPTLDLNRRDRAGLRFIAATLFGVALLFGSTARMTDLTAAGLTKAEAVPLTGPSWEGWAEPPSYTGRPSLYLNALAEGPLQLPEGTRLTLRLYGAEGDLDVAETVSVPAPLDPAAGPAAGDLAQAVRSVEFEAVRSGTIAIEGEGGRHWLVTVLADAAPTIAMAGDIRREADGEMSQPFSASDDYGVIRGRAEFTLDLAATDRRFGLAAVPEPREMLVYDLPMPISGSRESFAEALVENASEHPWANLAVAMTFHVEDARGQTGASETRILPLPGRRFFDPMAAALIEARRDLLWSRANGPRTVQVLRAVTHRPEGLFRSDRAYLMLRVALRRLASGTAQGLLSPDLRDEIAVALWEIAVLIEDGGLSDALDRMQRAQERLSEAIRNGASPEEIQELMDELRAATDDYIRMLAERGETDPADRFAQNQEGQRITGDQLQEMMDEIQRLMEEGRMAEAQALLEQLNRMMENLRVTQGEGGEGEGSPGQQAMRDLQETLRDQQGLSDETFRDLQNQPGEGGEEGEGQGLQSRRPGTEQGQGPGDQQGGQGNEGGEGTDGQGQGQADSRGDGAGGGSLAQRQRDLRDRLRGQTGSLPGLGAEGDEARRLLDEAGRAMREAEEALRRGQTPDALDRQAEAIENLREGMRSLGEALAQDQRQQRPEGQGEALGQTGRVLPRDPLGRSTGQTGRVGTDENLLQGEDVYRRARDLLDEIRRRSGDQNRPGLELDYLRRLLDRF